MERDRFWAWRWEKWSERPPSRPECPAPHHGLPIHTSHLPVLPSLDSRQISDCFWRRISKKGVRSWEGRGWHELCACPLRWSEQACPGFNLHKWVLFCRSVSFPSWGTWIPQEALIVNSGELLWDLLFSISGSQCPHVSGRWISPKQGSYCSVCVFKKL